MRLGRLLSALAVLVALTAPGHAADIRTGEIKAGEFLSPTLARRWGYEVYLPAGYTEAGTRRYPVIFMLHGVADDASTWRIKADIGAMADGLIARGAMPPTILVMPVAGRSWYVNGPEKMETAFIADLIPEIDHLFHTRKNRNARAILGVSMGGYGAMRLALRYPDRFSSVALLSPAIYAPEPPPGSSARVAPAFQAGGNFDPERWRRMNYPSLLDDFVHSGWKLRVQLTAGLQDRLDTGAAAERFAAAWRERGYTADVQMFPGGHDFTLWRTTLPIALQFLAGPQRGAQTALIRTQTNR